MEAEDTVATAKRPSSKSADKLHVATGLQWNGHDICVTIRKAVYRGKRGTGEVVCGNFKNCIQISCGKQGVKVFKSGAVSAFGFRSIDAFHEYVSIVLTLFGKSATISAEETTIALAIYDTKLDKPPLHLRAFAQKCASRAQEGEDVEFTPEEFAGIKLKLPHPLEESKKVSATVRAKGSVKVYMGRPGADYQHAIGVITARLGRILAC